MKIFSVDQSPIKGIVQFGYRGLTVSASTVFMSYGEVAVFDPCGVSLGDFNTIEEAIRFIDKRYGDL